MGLFSDRSRLAGRVVLGLVFLALVGLLLTGGHVEALKAAGLVGGSAINGVASFFDILTSKLVWLGATAVSFAVVLVGIMFLSGHHRAHEIALKVSLGVFLLVAAPGIVA